MFKITIKGEAGKASADYNGDYIKIDGSHFDGFDYHESFHDYFHDEKESMKDCITNSYMEFHMVDGKLNTFVYYFSDRKLTEQELEILIDYTSGQLSDGIGEGFEQFPQMQVELDASGKEYDAYLSPWFYGQVLTAEQVEI